MESCLRCYPKAPENRDHFAEFCRHRNIGVDEDGAPFRHHNECKFCHHTYQHGQCMYSLTTRFDQPAGYCDGCGVHTLMRARYRLLNNPCTIEQNYCHRCCVLDLQKNLQLQVDGVRWQLSIYLSTHSPAPLEQAAEQFARWLTKNTNWNLQCWKIGDYCQLLAQGK